MKAHWRKKNIHRKIYYISKSFPLRNKEKLKKISIDTQQTEANFVLHFLPLIWPDIIQRALS